MGEERVRVLSLKSKSLCASHPLPGSGFQGSCVCRGGWKGGEHQDLLQKPLEALQMSGGNSL